MTSTNTSSSSSSSPSDLRRRLQELPPPNEFTLLADRVAILGRRISRKRELFLRLHGVTNRIEENDEWEEREQRTGSEDSLSAFRLKDARARRRARVRLETSSNGDKAMVIPQTGDPTGPSKTIRSDEKKSNRAEAIEREQDYSQSSAFEMSRRHPRSTSLSEPTSTRSVHHNNVAWHNVKSNGKFHTCRDFTPRENASRLIDLPSVAPFALNNVRPIKFGGYRPSSSMIMKNLSSGSESESANETNRGAPSVQKFDGRESYRSLELSSPGSKNTVNENPIVKMLTVTSSRSDVTRSVLPNLLPSTRSLRDDSSDHSQEMTNPPTPVYNAGQLKRNESFIRFSSQMENPTPDPSAKASCHKQAGYNEFPTKIPNEPWRNVPAKREYDENQATMPQAAPDFSARSYLSEPASLAINACNEQIHRNLLNSYDDGNFQQQVTAQFEDKCNEQKELAGYYVAVPKVHHNETVDRCSFNHSADQPKCDQVSFSENCERRAFNPTSWVQTANFYPSETAAAADKPESLIEGTKLGEEALSSEISEPFASENHSRSSCAAKVPGLQKEAVSSNRRSQNNTDASDRYEQETTTATNVPTLALNSQDISYSTSAGSREYSAVRSFDPDRLIKALSDVSLKQERQETVSRKRDDLYLDNNNTSGVSDLPTKGETWRVPRSSISESPKKSLTRVPSRIPVKIPSSKNISFTNVNKPSSSCKSQETSRRVAHDERTPFVDQSGFEAEESKDIDSQRSLVADSPYSEIYEQCVSSRPRDENVEFTIVKAQSSRFLPSDDMAAEYEAKDSYEPASLISSKLPSPQISFGNEEIYEKVGRLSSRFDEKAFFNEASYSSNRDYAKIDDDVRSKSDRSTSRKSIETVDMTSATGSPCPPKHKHDSLPRNELSRNVEENATWRTEDDCGSINNEEDAKEPRSKGYYAASNADQTGEMRYLRTSEHLESGIEAAYDWSPAAKSQLPQIDLSLEIERIARKQSRAKSDSNRENGESNHRRSLAKEVENVSSQVRRTQEICSFAASSPAGKTCEPRKKRKSQERFPFTISEASGALSTEQVDTSDCQLPDKHFDYTKIDDPPLEKVANHQLKAHPSITRLAASGLEDTVAEILCCVAEQEQHENESSSRSRMRAFMRMFSSKLRKSSKQRNTGSRSTEPAKIIYENYACQVDSKTDSCSSGDSMVERVQRLNKSVVLGSSVNLEKKNSLDMFAQEHPRRKYDRDNLWVRDIKDSLFGEKENDKVLQGKGGEDGSSRPTDDTKYSIFLATDFHSNKLSKSDNNDKFRSEQTVMSATDNFGRDETDPRELPSYALEVEEIEESLSSCFCLRLCRLLAPSGYRSVRRQASASKMKNSLRKKKK